MTAPSVEIVGDSDAWAEAAAARIARILSCAVADRGEAWLVLTGGSSPGPVYRRLAEPPHRDALDWPRVSFFWGDERAVPPDDRASNYRLARETLLDRLPAHGPAYRMKGELPPADAAERYAETIRRATGLDLPAFDLVLLGLGRDGHIASLFPQTPGIADDPRLVAATESPEPPHRRISLTLRALNAARSVLFLVTGTAKAELVARLLDGTDESAAALPAAQVNPRAGDLTWLLDGAAASRLGRGAGRARQGPLGGGGPQ